MTNAQWQALCDYCDEMGYTKKEVLKELKASGVIDPSAKVGDIGNCVTDRDYDSMLKFLAENV